jgi:tripeptide aminopeptidase
MRCAKGSPPSNRAATSTSPAMPSAPPDDLLARLRAHLRAIAEVPAPPFGEGERSLAVAQRWRAIGLEVHVDDLGNLVAPLPGGHGPRVMLMAHLDTVFPAGTDVRVREGEGGRWLAPGVSDNSAGLAVLTVLAEEVVAGRLAAYPRVRLAASVGEEGLGDLRGARRLVADYGADTDVLVAVDGGLGQVVSGAVGSRRLEAKYHARGGHSWGDRGSPSAIHALGDAIHALTRLEIPDLPRSSLNVGLVQGGSSVNAIAEEAGMVIDIRSVDADTLGLLVERVEQRLRSVARRHRVTLALQVVGDRPAGATADPALIDAARAALVSLGLEARVAPSSTDASAAVASGIPAMALGVARGGDAHRLSEWVEPDSLALGLQVLQGLLARLVTR